MTHPLAAQNLTIRRAARVIVENINLEFKAGQVSAIIGANGAGKSTLLAALAGLRELGHSDGLVLLEGTDIRGFSKGAVSTKLGFLPAYSSVPFPLSVRELILLAEPSETGFRGAVKDMELESLLEKPITQLSTGEAKRAWLALTLARETPILLLDEPLAGLDPRYQMRLLETLQVRAKAGACVVFIAHDIPYAARADRVIALADCKIVADGTPLQVLNSSLLRELYGVEVWIGLDPSSGALVPLPVRAV